MLMKLTLDSFLRRFGFQRRNKKHGGNINLGHDKIRQVVIRMNDYMAEDQPYLKTHYNIRDLAEEMKLPSYQLSALLNRHMGTNFNDYLNQYRVKHCQQLIMEGEAGNLNLKGLSAKCGFHNRNTFTTAFKKITGQTPSVYTRYQKQMVS
jgi:AraC-like DNA-binding protein